MKMHDPPHPGEVIRGRVIEPLGVSRDAAARTLGVTRKTLSELAQRKIGVSPFDGVRGSLSHSTHRPRVGSTCSSSTTFIAHERTRPFDA